MFMIHFPNDTADKQAHPECSTVEEVAHKIFGKTIDEVRAMGADIIALTKKAINEVEKEIKDVEQELDQGGDQASGGAAEGTGDSGGEAHSGQDAQQGSEGTGETGAASQTGQDA